MPEPRSHPSAITLQLTLKSDAEPFDLVALHKAINAVTEPLGYRISVTHRGYPMLVRDGDRLVDVGGTATLIGANLLGLAAP